MRVCSTYSIFLNHLSRISGVLLKEQEKTERQTNSALKALPALAKFIQAETSDIKELLQEKTGDSKQALITICRVHISTS